MSLDGVLFPQLVRVISVMTTVEKQLRYPTFKQITDWDVSYPVFMAGACLFQELCTWWVNITDSQNFFSHLLNYNLIFQLFDPTDR